MITVAVRGLNYGTEWVSNFKLVPMAMGENKDLSRLVSLHLTDAALIMLLNYID